MNGTRILFVTRDKKNMKSDAVFMLISLILIIPLMYSILIYLSTSSFSNVKLDLNSNHFFLFTYSLYILISLISLLIGKLKIALIASYSIVVLYVKSSSKCW